MSTPADWPPDDDRARSLEIYMWCGCGLATITVFTRLNGRIFICRTPGWDDFFVVAAYVFAISLYVTTQELFHNGYGHHRVYLTDEQIMAIQKLDIPVYISGIMSLALARTSIGIFLLRLVYPIKKLAIPVYIGLAINVIQSCGFIIWICVLCIPTSKAWDPSVEGSCMNIDVYTAVERFWGVLNVVVDFIFALFPFVILWRSKIPRKWRLMVYLLLCCGLLTSACGIGRIVATDLQNPDATWALIPLTYWAVSETTAVLILSCMPAFHQLAYHLSNNNTWNSLASRLIPSTVRVNNQQGASSLESREEIEELGPMEHGVEVRRDVFVELSNRSGHEEPTGTGISFEEQLAKSSTVHNVSRAWGQSPI